MTAPTPVPSLAPVAPIAVLVSGGGRSLENLAEAIARGELACRIALVLSSSPKAYALERARRLGIPAVVIDPGRAAFATIESHGCELAVMAGFLKLLRIPDRWLGRVLNIHPALLPSFGGKGFYGMRVHEAVIRSGAKESGCTVHYVDNEYDDGPILLQRRVPVHPSDTPEALAERVFEAEKIALPEALRLHLSGAARSPRR